jgi:hypothetical protein
LKGGKSGPALVPGKPEESILFKRIVNGQMPPDKTAKIEELRREWPKRHSRFGSAKPTVSPRRSK